MEENGKLNEEKRFLQSRNPNHSQIPIAVNYELYPIIRINLKGEKQKRGSYDINNSKANLHVNDG